MSRKRHTLFLRLYGFRFKSVASVASMALPCPVLLLAPMHAILTTIGTDGDVFPALGLGGELARRGHRVTLAAAENYESRARKLGMDFQPLISREENAALFENPDFWNPLKTGPHAARWGVRFLRRQYELLAGLAAVEDSVLIANPGVLAAMPVHETQGTPLVSLILQPWLIPSAVSPPVMPGMGWLQRAPAVLWRMVWGSIDLGAGLLIGRELNRLRKSRGLKPVRRLSQNWLSTQLVLGLFPEWFGPPQTDWPPRIQLTGFPRPAAGNGEELPQALLDFCRAGAPPVVFTFGTGMAQPGRQFRAALDACRLSGLRGIFLTKYPEQLPAPLPPSVLHLDFAPFRLLFPHCAAVVHHGGIGTATAAMAAGVPQLVCPVCFDQEDNGHRLRVLGVGDWLPARRQNGKTLSETLQTLMSPAVKTRCQEVARMLAADPDGLALAADAVERHAAAPRE